MNTYCQDSPINDYKHVAVVGAAGKMGSGISLLLLQEMALYRIAEKVPQENRYLMLIDPNPERLDGLKKYLQSQLQKWAEKNIIILRNTVAHIPSLISNKEIIDGFLTGAMDIAHFTTSLHAANQSQLIFEAIIENVESKIETLSTLKKESQTNPYFFSNTSSIPISVMNEKASLESRIIGFHFYNPPAIQKLIEIIPLENGDPSLTTLAIKIAEKLNKQVILSKDIAGFIGNGYFLREVAYACQVTQDLKTQHGYLQSIYLVNRVTQDFLLRPMGIFQLIDYVGLDVVANVGSIMKRYLKGFSYSDELFTPLFEAGKIGGQHSDGSQKDGFFQYEQNQIRGIYDPNTHSYVALENAKWKKECDEWLGMPPKGLAWKSLSKDPSYKEKIHAYFTQLAKETTPGATLAKGFIANLQQVLNALVEEGVALSLNDVDSILEKGFFHLYSSIEESKHLLKIQ